MANFRNSSSIAPFSVSNSNSAPPFADSAPQVTESAQSSSAATRGGRALHAGWRRLSTGLRGVRLYAVKVPTGGVYWLAEVMRDGAQLSRRFASELHARAWVRDLIQPMRSTPPFDLEELHSSLRTALRSTSLEQH